jgi:hypothetical protein
MRQDILSVLIADGQSTSSEVTIPEGQSLLAISLNDDGFDGANVGYEINFDGTHWLTVYQADSTTAHTTLLSSTKRYVPVNSAIFLASARGYDNKLRLKAASNQTGAITINLHFRQIR